MSQPHEQLLAKANRALNEGRLTEAKSFAEEALDNFPSSVPAIAMLGFVAMRQGAFSDAVDWLDQADRLDPSNPQIPLWLSVAYRSVQEPERARLAAMQAVDRAPRQGSAYNQLGLCHLDLQNWEEAEKCFLQAIKLGPIVSMVYENLGRSLLRQDRQEDAMDAFGKADALDASTGSVLLRLGNTFLASLDYGIALLCSLRVLDKQPGSVAGNLLAAKAFVALGRAGEAEPHARQAIELAPNAPDPHTVYASVLEALGRLDEARAEFERSIDMQPRQGFGYYGIVRSRKITPDDRPLMERTLQALQNPQTAPEHHAYLHYALGKAHEDLGEYKEAMDHYNQANRASAKFNSPPSQGLKSSSEGQALKSMADYDRAFFDLARPQGSDSELPIFVLGMMRSGTTLVEQILSSHPQIGAAGEQPFWLVHGPGPANPDPELAHEYLKLLERVAPGKLKVVDKMPNNYRHLGKIHAALPQARFVHIKRHPVDTCLSLWATPRSCLPEWQNRKDKMVEAYQGYLALMDHWRKVLPAECLFELQYEDLVADPGPLTRHLIEFCRVPWDDRCLSPEENRRAVNTPSVLQVRQPIYRSSVARWSRFEPWLDEFRDLLPSKNP